jgi:hypothetical protein
VTEAVVRGRKRKAASGFAKTSRSPRPERAAVARKYGSRPGVLGLCELICSGSRRSAYPLIGPGRRVSQSLQLPELNHRLQKALERMRSAQQPSSRLALGYDRGRGLTNWIFANWIFANRIFADRGLANRRLRNNRLRVRKVRGSGGAHQSK